MASLSYMSRGHKLLPLFGLTFRRSSLQHPLLAGALGGSALKAGLRLQLLADAQGGAVLLWAGLLEYNLIFLQQ